jgi:hypothetical protein
VFGIFPSLSGKRITVCGDGSNLPNLPSYYPHSYTFSSKNSSGNLFL